MPGGVIQRVCIDPPKTQYLSLDVPPTWSDDRDEAMFFERFEGKGSATEKALALRESLQDHIFPVVRTKPLQFRAVPDPLPAVEEADAEAPLKAPAAAPMPKRNRPRRAAPTAPAAVCAIPDDERFWWRKGAYG